MTKRMLIDSTHPEETRVVVLSGNRLEDFDFEVAARKQLKGNIYLAKITRVEPSLQAAFVDYGGNRHGFLAFSEIHPDYYRIPVEDRERLIAEQEAAAAADDAEAGEGGDGADEDEDVVRRRPGPPRSYKIQEVIKRRQIMLVQVVKEERGTKGAALTTYISLAGRYCVLMPNTPRGGGISRKITNPVDRKRLKSVLSELELPQGIAVIVRTAGSQRSKAEIKRDYEYLLRLWDKVREDTLSATAPSLIYEEGDLVKRTIRDLYQREIEEVLVAGDEGYRTAKTFMKMIIPSHAKRVQPYRDEKVPLMHRYKVESQLDAIHNPMVHLKSGGYLVINPTEALVSIDVNSGRATRERHIEETALKTNLEASDEIARQLRLRDLAGLIVIDYIDMDDSRNNHAVERRLKEALKTDRARIQIGRISNFGLLEMSRQRLRPSLQETSTVVCPHCAGLGHVRSIESSAVRVLRGLEEEGMQRTSIQVTVHVPSSIALYVLNNKRHRLADFEARYGYRILVEADDSLRAPDYRIERIKGAVERPDEPQAAAAAPAAADDEPAAAEEESGRGRGRRRRRRGGDDADARSGRETAVVEAVEAEDAEDAEEADESEDGEPIVASDPDGDEASRKRRRRGRRGGRRRRTRPEDQEGTVRGSEDHEAGDDAVTAGEGVDAIAPAGEPAEEDESSAPVGPVEPADAEEAAADASAANASTVEAGAEGGRPGRRTRSRRRGPRHAATDTDLFADPREEAADTAAAPEATPEAEAEDERGPDTGFSEPADVAAPEPVAGEVPAEEHADAVGPDDASPADETMAGGDAAVPGVEEVAADHPGDGRVEEVAVAAIGHDATTPGAGAEPEAAGEDLIDHGGEAEAEVLARSSENAAAAAATDLNIVGSAPERPRRGWWRRLVE